MKIKSYQPLLALMFVSGILHAAPTVIPAGDTPVTIEGNVKIVAPAAVPTAVTNTVGVGAWEQLVPTQSSDVPNLSYVYTEVGGSTQTITTIAPVLSQPGLMPPNQPLHPDANTGIDASTNGNLSLHRQISSTEAATYTIVDRFEKVKPGIFNYMHANGTGPYNQGDIILDAMGDPVVEKVAIYATFPAGAAPGTPPTAIVDLSALAGVGAITSPATELDATQIAALKTALASDPTTLAGVFTSPVGTEEGGNLFVEGDATVVGKINAGDINSSGKITAESLETTGAATVGGALTVEGASTLKGLATTNGIANTGQITTDTLVAAGRITTNGIDNTGDVVTDVLLVKGASTVLGLSTTNGIANTGAITTDTLTTTGDATIGGALGVTGLTTTNGIANTGAIETDTLHVRGAAKFDARIATNGIDNVGDIQTDALVVNGATTLRGLATTNGINNTGAINTSTLNVSGASNFDGPMTTNGINNNGQKITGVGNGTNAGDAVNFGQLSAETDARIAADRKLRSGIDENTRGIAMVAAMTNTRVEAGKCHGIDFNLAQYQGETGFAFGYANRINDNLQIHGAIASTTDFDESVVRVGLAYQW